MVATGGRRYPPTGSISIILAIRAYRKEAAATLGQLALSMISTALIRLLSEFHHGNHSGQRRPRARTRAWVGPSRRSRPPLWLAASSPLVVNRQKERGCIGWQPVGAMVGRSTDGGPSRQRPAGSLALRSRSPSKSIRLRHPVAPRARRHP
jgi:hypothetical protein